MDNDSSARRGRGRPITPRELAQLVVRMAVEKPRWGYTRIRDALANLGHQIARNTVKRILRDHGIEPASERSKRTPWKTFLEARWGGLAAADLFTVEVLTLAGLRRHFVLTSSGVQPIKLPARNPNLNTYAERLVRSIKEECLNRVVLLGESHLRFIVEDYVEHYHRERNHQGLDNQLLERSPPPANADAEVHRHQRIGGLLNYYHREAA